MVTERKDKVQGRREEQPSFLCEVDRLSDLMGQISKSRMLNCEEASIGLAMLGARREGAFAVQVDVRKKVLWGRWAECVLAGARNRRGRETLPTNGGGDERVAAVVTDSVQQSG